MGGGGGGGGVGGGGWAGDQGGSVVEEEGGAWGEGASKGAGQKINGGQSKKWRNLRHRR